jgi:hypothetical protein
MSDTRQGMRARVRRAHVAKDLARKKADRFARWYEAVMDGKAVFDALSPRSRAFVSPEAVTEVLDAVARVARGRG